jgi:hypothetical protein
MRHLEHLWNVQTRHSLELRWNVWRHLEHLWNVYDSMQDLSKDRHIPDSQTIQTVVILVVEMVSSTSY